MKVEYPTMAEKYDRSKSVTVLQQHYPHGSYGFCSYPDWYKIDPDEFTVAIFRVKPKTNKK